MASDCVEPFDDGERLRQQRAIVQLERRHEALRVHREIVRRALLALAQMTKRVLGLQAFQIERDAHAIGRR